MNPGKSQQEMATPSSILAWKIHRQRSLPGYSPGGPKELEATERACRHTQTASGTWTLETQFRAEGLDAEMLSVPRGGELALHSSLFRVQDASVTESSKRNSEGSLCLSPSLIKVKILFSFLSVHKSRY